MLGVNDLVIGALPRDRQGEAMQTPRGWTNAGLKARPVGRWTFEVTAGDDAADTFNLLADGVSILLAPVAWTTSHSATATAIATAVNANSMASGFYATVSSATVTIRQRSSGLVAMTKAVVNDAEGTLTAAFASSNTWTEIISGATFDGDEYYQLVFDGSLVRDVPAGVDLSNAVAAAAWMRVTGQAFQLWSGKGVQTAGNVILSGDPTAADTWTEKLPWVSGLPLTVKLAADAPLIYRVLYL